MQNPQARTNFLAGTGWKEGSAGATTSSSGDIIQGEEAVQWGAGFLNGGPEGAILQPADVRMLRIAICPTMLQRSSVPTYPQGAWSGLRPITMNAGLRSAWVDPVSSLSQFDHCYEERSKDPSRAFQDALNQALRQKETASSNKWNPKSRFWAEEDEERRGKGKRARKPKLHFDVSQPAFFFALGFCMMFKNQRRMEAAADEDHAPPGLVAPAGSPFNRAHGSRRA
ncbi:unnamed protein product [Spirodela intermedia]|uniref:Uncharacterized protein n=1 Tax=Spirodela intermedia TaxID=51605 RepID=A0A7I8JT22_SPIIN|nr:unnamed protein product [Spirodela intermedia]CAA6673328.1 unnamed protein product [Spirodela intermedia]